jgi:two-component system, chemotaxis family, CheB/CheR fusion protein
MDLRIRRFTTAAERLLNLVPGDTGRTIDYVRRFVGDVNVAAKVATVIETLAIFEQDVLCENGRYYKLRIVPYKTLSHEIRGAVITLVDVDVSKRAADLAEDVDAYAAKFLSGTKHPVIIVDDKFRVVWANDALRDTFQLAPEEMVGSLLRTVGPVDWDDAILARKLEDALSSGRAFSDFPLRSLGPTALSLSARRLDGLGRDFLLLLSITKGDIDTATEGPTP